MLDRRGEEHVSTADGLIIPVRSRCLRGGRDGEISFRRGLRGVRTPIDARLAPGRGDERGGGRRLRPDRRDRVRDPPPFRAPGRPVGVDFGCGSGRLAVHLARTGTVAYLGLDVVQELLDYAKR